MYYISPGKIVMGSCGSCTLNIYFFVTCYEFWIFYVWCVCSVGRSCWSLILKFYCQWILENWILICAEIIEILDRIFWSVEYGGFRISSKRFSCEILNSLVLDILFCPLILWILDLDFGCGTSLPQIAHKYRRSWHSQNTQANYKIPQQLRAWEGVWEAPLQCGQIHLQLRDRI